MGKNESFIAVGDNLGMKPRALKKTVINLL